MFLSTRRGAWIFNRVGDQGYPIDTILTTRLKTFLQGLLSSSITCDFMEKKLNARFDHSRYGLKPKHRYHQTPPLPRRDRLPPSVSCPAWPFPAPCAWTGLLFCCAQAVLQGATTAPSKDSWRQQCRGSCPRVGSRSWSRTRRRDTPFPALMDSCIFQGLSTAPHCQR